MLGVAVRLQGGSPGGADSSLEPAPPSEVCAWLAAEALQAPGTRQLRPNGDRVSGWALTAPAGSSV